MNSAKDVHSVQKAAKLECWYVSKCTHAPIPCQSLPERSVVTDMLDSTTRTVPAYKSMELTISDKTLNLFTIPFFSIPFVSVSSLLGFFSNACMLKGSTAIP